jgi:hypothetical protein
VYVQHDDDGGGLTSCLYTHSHEITSITQNRLPSLLLPINKRIPDPAATPLYIVYTHIIIVIVIIIASFSCLMYERGLCV